ncbi:ABC transporter substrate-binding protein [Undibacterium sp. RuRC25W]|uniref:ABC transporter substrate-binding protein n=1 Tax=Undibacterium sp. RuRC25W TaxID=3413047 RepID=UPI003BF1B7DE
MQIEKKLLPYAEFASKSTPKKKSDILKSVLFLIVFLLFLANAHAQTVQVLHWWTSTSEEKAIAVLSGRLAQENIVWKNAVIPSGSGIGAGIVLKSRMLAGDAPEVAQLNGVMIAEWAQLGLLQEMDTAATAARWEKLLQPTVWHLIQPNGHPVALPLGIHRINTLFYNRKLFAKYDLTVPTNWDEFEITAKKLQQLGIIPLAQSSEPWQLATLFETLVLSESDANFYRDAFVSKKSQAFIDPRFGRALSRLRKLKQYMPVPLTERTWFATTKLLADGDAAMLVMGDWAKGELNSLGLATDNGFSCTVVPNTGNYHLYDIDTLVMIKKGNTTHLAQDKIAQVALQPAVQSEYNQLKGSIPVLRNPDLSKMDSCAQASWKSFSRGVENQVPSFSHRMATDEISKEAIIAEVIRFFVDDRITVSETQKRLAAISRTLPK